MTQAAPLVPLGAARAWPEPDAVVILRFSALGDVLLTTPALQALRAAWPRARILYCIKERLAPALAREPAIDELVPLAQGEGPLSLSRRLRGKLAGRRVVLLDLHGKIRSKLIRACLPRGWRRVVWVKRDARDTLPVKLALRPYHAQMLFADRYHAAVEEAVGRKLPRGELRAIAGAEDISRARQLLVQQGIDSGANNPAGARPLIGMSPGANWATKRWPAGRYGELARRALERGWDVVVQGSREEMPLAAEVCAMAREVRGADGKLASAIDLAGRLDLPALTGLVSLCSAFVANDSGPMHLARALKIPTLAFFGSTDPEMFEWGGHRVLFRGDLSCAPCSFFGRRRCPRGHFRCMLELPPGDAFAALEQLVAAAERKPVSG